MSTTQLKIHPLSEIFPLMEGVSFEGLVTDIKAEGLLEPIWLYDGKILDGRNRYRACLQADVEPTFREYSGSDPLGFTVSLNLKRRHLDESQRGMVAAAIANMKQGARTDLTANAVRSQISQEQAADLLNVSTDTIQRAVTVREQGIPDLVHLVEAGAISVSKAASVAKQNKRYQKSVATKVAAGMKATEAVRQTKKEMLPETVAKLPKGKFRVIYSDPPWKYNDSRQTSDNRESTGALHHYADMTIKELEKIDVKSISAKDCVLLCWATFPLLPDNLCLVKSWGFQYKTAFVWDKGHGSFGHYHDAEAELLLVATKGSCTPETDKKVKQIQRFKRGKHSAKPSEWHTLINKLWPTGPRIEMFARANPPKKWKRWGTGAEAK